MANADRRPSEPIYPQKLRVPRTPLESRQGYHPKMDAELVWRSPPTRQLSREKRVEYESDVRERFYDDYLGPRTTGDARNEVQTGLSKLKYDPSIYRANAMQGLVYDPARVVPTNVNLHAALREEKTRSRQREIEEFRMKRRMSEPNIMMRPQRLEPLVQYKSPDTTTLPSISTQRPRSALQKTLDDSLNPEIVPAVESWFNSASKEEKKTASKFLRTLSSHGKRPDPASKAALHSTRVRSAVMTPSRKQRMEKEAQNIHQKISKKAKEGQQLGSLSDSSANASRRPHFRRSTSTSEKSPAQGGMFTVTRDQPSHFAVHPEWASEAINPPHW